MLGISTTMGMSTTTMRITLMRFCRFYRGANQIPYIVGLYSENGKRGVVLSKTKCNDVIRLI